MIPVEPSAKGPAAVDGLEVLVVGLEVMLDIDVGVLAAVLVGVKDTNDQADILDNTQYPTPETFDDRTSLMRGYWVQQCSTFTYMA